MKARSPKACAIMVKYSISQTTPLIKDRDRLENRLKEIPAEPGVYVMRDRSETILYIGKSKKLRSRVRSYFRDSQNLSHRITNMVRQVWEIEFIVTDSGIGIPQTDRGRLFESFYRGDNIGNIGGTGLGLSIVKKCVDLYQGTIEFNSEVDVGTVFTVTLPLSYPIWTSNQTTDKMHHLDLCSELETHPSREEKGKLE